LFLGYPQRHVDRTETGLAPLASEVGSVLVGEHPGKRQILTEDIESVVCAAI